MKLLDAVASEPLHGTPGQRQKLRPRRRLLKHYLPLAALTLLGTAGLAAWVASPSLPYRLSMATAFSALVLFGISLAIGPVSLLKRGRLPPVSTDLRRDVGILAGVVSIAHVVVGFMVYSDIRLYFLYPEAEWQHVSSPLRLDDFGVANWTGLAATVLLVLLLVTSGDWALRHYGARRWKGLQQLAYWCFALTFVHGVLYQRLDPHDEQPLVVAFAAIILSVAALQAVGFIRAGASSTRRAARIK